MDTKGGEEAGTAQLHTRHKKGAYGLTDSDEETIINFVKDNEELYNMSSATGEDSENNKSGPSSLFGNLQSVVSYQQIDTHQPHPSDPHQHTTSPPTTTPDREKLSCRQPSPSHHRSHSSQSKTSSI